MLRKCQGQPCQFQWPVLSTFHGTHEIFWPHEVEVVDCKRFRKVTQRNVQKFSIWNPLKFQNNLKWNLWIKVLKKAPEFDQESRTYFVLIYRTKCDWSSFNVSKFLLRCSISNWYEIKEFGKNSSLCNTGAFPITIFFLNECVCKKNYIPTYVWTYVFFDGGRPGSNRGPLGLRGFWQFAQLKLSKKWPSSLRR